MNGSYYEIFTNYQTEGYENHLTWDRYLAVWDDEDIAARVEDCFGKSAAKDFRAVKVDTFTDS